ncbi:MAG TPA: hypothetical protein DEP29_04570 [Bifidobacterium sp.]|nr:hypothetical protein [Bifidobacterium sp.]HCA74284.1 hypothetical protein [Bifidobacterium sp.]
MYQPPTAYTGMPTRRARMVERIRKAERPERTIRRKNHPPEEPFAGRDADTGTPHPRDRE